MKSMTGFGRACGDFGEFSVSVDISSVNKKGTEVSVSLPREWIALERVVNAEIKKRFSRGKFNAAFNVKFSSADSAAFAPKDELCAALESLRDICLRNNVQFSPTQETILKLNDALLANAAKPECDCDALWQKLLPVFDKACAELDAMRLAEGRQLCADISARLETMARYVSAAQTQAENSPKNYRQNLEQKLQSLGLELDVNDERVLKEVCIFADKCDVAEEITRLKSHLAQFGQIMKLDEAVGRKLDFLCQEMGREINTTASKANNLELTKTTIEMKNELERIREQIQNIE